MSLLQPTNNTSIIIDDFIAYATAHLQTVSGVINTVSLYPPLGTPGPGVVLWSGYTVAPAKQQSSAAQQQQQSNDASTTADGQKIDDKYEKPPVFEKITIHDSARAEDTDLPPGTFGKFENNIGTGNYNPPKGTYEINPINTNSGNAVNSATYGGLVNMRVSTETTIRNVYIPVLNKVHADKSLGIRLLMTAQTQSEGFFKAGDKDWTKTASLSYTTNNPGNIYPNGDMSGFKTLEEGVLAQWKWVLGPIFARKSNNYNPEFSSLSLFNYLSRYAPIKDDTGKPTKNNPTEYTNYVIAYFKKQGYSITADTTLEEIKNITK
jgi:hypothetical protein